MAQFVTSNFPHIFVQLPRVGSRPQAFESAIDEVSTLTLRLPKGGSKNEFVVLVKLSFC